MKKLLFIIIAAIVILNTSCQKECNTRSGTLVRNLIEITKDSSRTPIYQKDTIITSTVTRNCWDGASEQSILNQGCDCFTNDPNYSNVCPFPDSSISLGAVKYYSCTWE